jgi:hypothetical protein
MRESAHIDPVSPGEIQGAEILCRAGYTMHNKNGNPAVSLVRANELAIGELSVWRIAASLPSADLDELVHLLRERAPNHKNPQELLWIFGLPAEKLRGLIEECPICAVDDTDCGPNWDRHPRHCTLGGCSYLRFDELASPEAESPAFHAMRRRLVEEFRQSLIWPAVA